MTLKKFRGLEVDYIKLPDGTYFEATPGEYSSDTYARAYKKYPEAFNLPPNSVISSNTTQMQTNEIITSGAYLEAIVQSASAVLWIVFFVYIAKAWKKSYYPLQLRVRWAAWFGGFGGAVYFSRAVGVIFFNLNYTESLQELIAGCLLLTITGGVLGFILGWLYGKIFKFKAEQRSTNKIEDQQDDESLYEVVANEIEAGDIQKGLWTKAFAQCNGNEAQTKALYIRMRVEQFINLKNSAVDRASIVKIPIQTTENILETFMILLVFLFIPLGLWFFFIHH